MVLPVQSPHIGAVELPSRLCRALQTIRETHPNATCPAIMSASFTGCPFFAHL